MKLRRAFLCVVVLVLSVVSYVMAASNDNNVEWNGAGHSVTCTGSGCVSAYIDTGTTYPYFSADTSSPKKIRIRLRVYQGDITSANIVWTTNASASSEEHWTYTSMSWEANITKDSINYDSWTAEIPGQINTTVYYKIQVNDGTDTDWVTRSGEGSSIVDDNTLWTVGSTSLSYDTGPNAITLSSFTAASALPAAIPWLAGMALALGGALAWRRKRR